MNSQKFLHKYRFGQSGELNVHPLGRPALSLLKAETMVKAGTKRKRNTAGRCVEQYLGKLQPNFKL